MNITGYILVAMGGAIGSVVRAAIGAAIPAGRLPWATLVVNATGSLLIGCLMARFGTSAAVGAARIHAFWAVGFCGGFTTFSTFSWQSVDQMQKGQWAAAAANIALSLVVCLFATWLGWRLAR